MTDTPQFCGHPRDAALSVLARARPDRTATLAESLLDPLGAVEVITSRSGLVMVPMRDTVHGTDFHLGEVLVSEAHIRAAGCLGYGMVTGRDLTRAMSMAVIDAAGQAGIAIPAITDFLNAEAAHQQAEDTQRLRDIAATRVDLETL
jgi:alpha-D-ribose 1-methylphosphonate 5-triphosphate synthase subunit PhnG